MPIVTIVKPFMLNDGKTLKEFIPGRYEVTDEEADHWYLIAHTEGYVEPPPKTGTDQQRTLLAEQAARLNEAPAETAQAPAQAPMTPILASRARTNQFAGRRNMPKEPEQTPSFLDPSKMGP